MKNRHWVRFIGMLALCLLHGVPTQTGAQTYNCRQALAIGLDVSGSVDALEYRLQLNGLAEALDSPGVKNALLATPSDIVEILVFEWSGVDDQATLVDWTAVQTRQDILDIQDTLRKTKRRPANPGTALGPAMLTGLQHLNSRPRCQTRTLDISGDGKSNIGAKPDTVHNIILDAQVTVNALVIGADSPGVGDLRQEEIGELVAYFQANVIVGPDAFVQTALGFESFKDAMTRKLERELKGPVLSHLRLNMQATATGTAPQSHQ